MANSSLRSLTAALLLGWTLCLTLHASLALAELLHHHDGSEDCAQAQLIDTWLKVTPIVTTDIPATASLAVPPASNRYAPLARDTETAGNRDPPALPPS